MFQFIKEIKKYGICPYTWLYDRVQKMGSLNDIFECTHIFYMYAQDRDMTKCTYMLYTYAQDGDSNVNSDIMIWTNLWLQGRQLCN